jgi:hypothetical protein
MTEPTYKNHHIWVPRLSKELDDLRSNGFPATMIMQDVVTLDGDAIEVAVGIEVHSEYPWSIRAHFGDQEWRLAYWEPGKHGDATLITKSMYLKADNLSWLVQKALEATNQEIAS